MHRHPLDADGMVGSLFLSLWKKHPETLDSCSGVLIPDTVLYEHGFPRAWLASDVSGRPSTRPVSAPMRRPSTSPASTRLDASFSSTQKLGVEKMRTGVVETYELKKRQGKEIDPRMVYAAMTKQPNQELDVVAMYLEKTQENSATAVVEYLTRKELSEMFPDPKVSNLHSHSSTRRQRTGYQGIVQKMVYAASNTVSVIQATWSPYLCIVDRRINMNAASDVRFTPYERAVTHEGPQHFSRSVPCAPPTEDKVRLICECIVRHVQAVENATIARMVLYFRPDAHNRLYLSWCDSMRLSISDPLRGINLAINYQTPDHGSKKSEQKLDSTIPSLDEKSPSKSSPTKTATEEPIPCPGCDTPVLPSRMHAAGVGSIVEYHAKQIRPRPFSNAVRSRMSLDSFSPRNPRGGNAQRERTRSVAQLDSARSSSPSSPSPSSSPPAMFLTVNNSRDSESCVSPLPAYEELPPDVRARKIAQATVLNEQRQNCMAAWEEEVWYRLYSHFLISRNQECRVSIPPVFDQVNLLLKGEPTGIPVRTILETSLKRVHIKCRTENEAWIFSHSQHMNIGKWESLIGAVGREMENLLEDREAQFWGISSEEMKTCANKPVSYVLTEIERKRREAYTAEVEKRQKEQEIEEKRRRRRVGSVMGRTQSTTSVSSDFSDDGGQVPKILKSLFPEASSMSELAEKKQMGTLQSDVVSVKVCQHCYLSYCSVGKTPAIRRSPSVMSNHSTSS